MSQLDIARARRRRRGARDAASWVGLIVDGHHVHPEVLKIALRAKRHDRFMLVSATPCPASAPTPTNFELQGRPITVEGDRIVDDDGRLAGARSRHGERRAQRRARCSASTLGDAVRMASRNPAEFLTLGDEVGRIAPGQRANLALVDDELQVLETWIDGV